MTSAIVCWTACILGLLAQFLFVQILLSLMAWVAWRLLREPARRRECLPFALQYFALPLTFTIVLYLTFIGRMQALGPTLAPMSAALSDTAAFMVGLPRDLGLVALPIVAAAIVAGLIVLWRQRDDRWMLLGMLCLGAPLLMLLATRPPFLLPRSFMLSITGFLLLLALLLAKLLARGGVVRLTAAALLAAFLAGNSFDTRDLLRYGRGQYLQAMLDMARRAPGGMVRIAGDHDFREGIVVLFYAPNLPEGRDAVYVTREQMQQTAPDFLVFQGFDAGSPAHRQTLSDKYGRSYEQVAVYPSGPMSGWWWYVYQRRE